MSKGIKMILKATSLGTQCYVHLRDEKRTILVSMECTE
jgi:hypothetical protein